MENLLLDGEFYVDGYLCYSALFPKISFANGLDLVRKTPGPDKRLVTEDDGPHFSLDFFRPWLLTTAHSVEEIRASPRYLFQGPRLGGIARSGGYTSRHSHSNLRRVTEAVLSLSFSKEKILVRINGSAGAVTPGNGFSDQATLTFELWFSLPLQEIRRIAPEVGEIGFKTLMDKLDQL